MLEISTRAKVAMVAFGCAVFGYLAFDRISSWLYHKTVVSYEDGFSVYVMREQIGLHFFTGLVAFVAASIYRPTRRTGVVCGVTGALMFRILEIWIYSLQSTRWIEYRGIFTPTLTAIIIGAVAGHLAVSLAYKQRAEQNAALDG